MVLAKSTQLVVWDCLSFISHVTPTRKSSSLCALLQGKKHELMTRNPKRNKRPCHANKEIQSTISTEFHGKRFWYAKVVLLVLSFLDCGDRETDERYTWEVKTRHSLQETWVCGKVSSFCVTPGPINSYPTCDCLPPSLKFRSRAQWFSSLRIP